MADPERRPSRAKWALLAAILIVGAGTLALTLDADPAPETRKEQPSPPAQPVPSPVAPKAPVDVQPLGREALLSIVAAAADAAASGAAPSSETNRVIGRSFLLRLPFGCSGSSTDLADSWAGWSIDPATRTLKLRAKAENWATAPWIRAIAPDMPVEAVEGFWVRRPWTSSERCPVMPQGPVEVGGPPNEEVHLDARQTVGLAQFFAPEGSRTLRRGERPYAATLKVEKPDTDREYRVALSGRIVGYPDGRSTRCLYDHINRPPTCLVAVDLTRVAFEDARNGAVLSEWRN